MNGQKKETEALKLMAVRAGMMDVAQSWETLGNKCLVLAQSQKVCTCVRRHWIICWCCLKVFVWGKVLFYF